MPQTDFDSLELTDILDIKAIQVLLNDFYSITNLGISILDLKGKVLVATGWQTICTQYHRLHPETARNCQESDLELSRELSAGTFRIYRCKNNMNDIITPLVVGGKHLGNVYFGQFFFEDEIPDIKVFEQQANRFGFDVKNYLLAYKQIPIYTKEHINHVMNFYIKLTTIISELSNSNLKLRETISASEKVKKQLLKTQNELLENQRIAKMGRWELDIQNNRLEWSDSLFDIFEINKKDFNATYDAFIHAVHPDDRSMVTKAYQESLQHKRPYNIIHRIKLPDGKIKWLNEICHTDYDSQGKAIKSIGITHDITLSQQAEIEKSQLQTQILHSSKLASIGTLAAGVAHEINNPMAIILGNAELIKTRCKNICKQGVDELTQRIIESADRVIKIVNGLKTYARQDINRTELIDLHHCINETVALVKTMWEKDNIQIKTNLNANRYFINANNGKIQQVIMNLLTNARDAILLKGEGTISISTQNDLDGISISFSDNGVGIPEHLRQKLFDPFFTTKEPGKGTGLGLAISHSIVESFNGTIKVESEAGVHTTFKLFFKNHYEIQPSVSIPITSSSKDINISGTVLVVDDEAYIRDILFNHLSSIGLEVVHAEDGEDAYQKVQNFSYDFIITDIKMPKMSGDTLIQKIRDNQLAPHSKILYISGGLTDYTKAQIEHLNQLSDGFINKPFKKSDVIKALTSNFKCSD